MKRMKLATRIKVAQGLLTGIVADWLVKANLEYTIKHLSFKKTNRKSRSYIIPFKLVHMSLRLFQLAFPRITKLTIHADEHVGICSSIGDISSKHMNTVTVLCQRFNKTANQ